ncbi:MAG: sigma-70 family RNA polymerase sigma factor [Alphaproteobacteria bacterium]|nr:sigma-70 family RNA polymerase sigma factor [Alphaproteobacteria bacterium]
MSRPKPPDLSAFVALRPHLLGLAYRMLGSRSEAEDVAQDAWLRWAGVDGDTVENPRAFLTRIVTRLCLDRLKAARLKRESYVGPWLPEPIIDDDSLRPDLMTELGDDLSFGLLLALETLSPAERAAFLLHDVFDLPFTEIASVLDVSEANSRQLASRARKAVRAGRRKTVDAPAHQRLVGAFLGAVASGDLDRLKTLLREDVVAISDGGGHARAALNPIRGADRVARLFLGLARKNVGPGLELRPLDINGATGLATFFDDRLDQTLLFETDGAHISAIYLVRNPEKLDHLRRVVEPAGAASDRA